MSDRVRDTLDHCVKCTICETMCPVAAVTPLFPGPKYVGPQAERYRDPAGEVSPDQSLDYCSGCGTCTLVCPQGVKVAEINAQARAAMKAQRGMPWRDRFISNTILGGRLSMLGAPVYNRVITNPLARRAIERGMGVHRAAPMPRVQSTSFRTWTWGRALRGRKLRSHRRVVYFHGCAANYYETRLARRAVAVLEHQGLEVLIPRQGCCGLPQQSNGLFDEARDSVTHLAAQLAPYARRGLDILGTSTSCSLMLRREAREVLSLEDRPDMRDLAPRVFDICEYLLAMHHRGELRTDFQPMPMTVPYHPPCQLKAHNIGTPAVELLGLIPGMRLIDSNVTCCGVAGTYGLKTEKYDIAMAVGEPLFRQVRGSEMACCDSETCRWQIETATGVTTVHPVDLLYMAYGLG
ncbi:MAG: anaerobic glycerol-3-phosphate dehydrogenase subunit C [Thermoleophilia bacterium]